MLDKREREIRIRFENTDVKVVRDGEKIIVLIPNKKSFSEDATVLSSNSKENLDFIAEAINKFPHSTVEVKKIHK
jgi:outer membrane protein OmpA-like peptidoglycan-associated protein